MKILKIFLAQLLINLKNAFSYKSILSKRRVRSVERVKSKSKNKKCGRNRVGEDMFTLVCLIKNKLLEVGNLALNPMSDNVHYVYFGKKTRGSGELSLFGGGIPLKSFLGVVKPLYIPLLSKTFQKALFFLIFRKKIQKGVNFP